MYIYALIGTDSKVVDGFEVYSSPLTGEELFGHILVDAVDETWIQRKRWVEETQQFVDVLPSETGLNVRNSLEFTHIDSNGTKHWLDVFVNDLASNSVETATVSEVETYLAI